MQSPLPRQRPHPSCPHQRCTQWALRGAAVGFRARGQAPQLCFGQRGAGTVQTVQVLLRVLSSRRHRSGTGHLQPGGAPEGIGGKCRRNPEVPNGTWPGQSDEREAAREPLHPTAGPSPRCPHAPAHAPAARSRGSGTAGPSQQHSAQQQHGVVVLEGS